MIEIKDKDNNCLKGEVTKALPIWGLIQNQKTGLNFTANGGNQCSVSAIDLANIKNQLFQRTNDGHFLSNVNSNLTIGSAGGNIIFPCVQSYLVSNDDTQNWSINSEGQISSKPYPNLFWQVDGNNKVILSTITDNSDTSFKWSFLPGCPLDSIISQPRQPFLAAENEEQKTAYIDLSYYATNNINPDIRSQYSVIDAPLSMYGILIGDMKCPTGISYDNFKTVQNQLLLELSCAVAVQSLFSNFNSLNTTIFANKQNDLNSLISLCELDSNSSVNVSGCILAATSSIMYTLISEIPVFGGILANLFQTGVNIYAASDYGTTSPTPFQVTVNNLYNQLSTYFTQLFTIVNKMQTNILSDWGMMYSTYSLILQPVGTPNSLAWTPDMNSQLFKYSSIAYDISTLQMLTASNYQIYCYNPSYLPMGHPIPSNIPDYCKWNDSRGYLYFIASLYSYSNFPNQELMNTIWNKYNIQKQDFFLSNNGWSFPTASVNGQSKISSFSIGNFTPTPMQFQVVYNKKSSGWIQAPNFSSGFTDFVYSVGALGHDSIQVTINDLSHGWIATVIVDLHLVALQGSYVSIKSSTVNNTNYSIGSGIGNQGSLGQAYTAACFIPIYYNPNK